MRAISLTRPAITAACFLAAGCATNPAPRGWLLPADSAQRDPYGAWMVVTYGANSGGPARRAAGELLAVDPDTVFLLSPGDTLIAVPRDRVLRGRLAYYDAQIWAPSLWTAVGTMSTLSHGFVLLVSAPVWIVTGTAATASQSHRPIIDVRRNDGTEWRVVGRYARFPLGMPVGVDRRGLRGKR